MTRRDETTRDFLNMDIRKILLDEIALRGWTPMRLAKDSGVPYSTCQEFMRSNRTIGIDKASKMLDALDLKIVRVEKEPDELRDFMIMMV